MCDLTTPAGRQQARLKHALDRLASEVVGAAALLAQLRPMLSYEARQKGVAFRNTLEAQRDAAKAAWEAACALPVDASQQQKEEIIRLLNYGQILPAEKSRELLGLLRQTSEGAERVMAELKATINSRAGYVVFPEVVAAGTYVVVGSAEMVGVEQAA